MPRKNARTTNSLKARTALLQPSQRLSRQKRGGSAPAGEKSRELTFRAFQALIREKYLKTDAARGSGGTFLLLMEEVGELATALHDNRPAKSKHNPMGKKRPITEEERANLLEEFADVIAWLATLANMHEVDLDEALKKYTQPGRVEGIKY